MPSLRRKALVKSNLELWLNDLFLKDAFYTDISTSETDVYSRDISQLISVPDPTYADGIVWQSAFREWVYESGIIPTQPGITPPIIASGVTVDGVFYSNDPTHPSFNPSFSHAIDFRNGRVIFGSPISTSSVVQGQFSFKEIGVELSSAFENENKEFYFETLYKDNPYQTGVIVYPQEGSRTLPIVLIDISKSNQDGYELGNRSTTIEYQGSFIVWSRDDYMRDQIEDLISEQENYVLLGINFNTAPFPLDYRNSKNLSYTSYANFASLSSPYFWRRIYLDSVDSRRLPSYSNIERTQINFIIRVYPNF